MEGGEGHSSSLFVKQYSSTPKFTAAKKQVSIAATTVADIGVAGIVVGYALLVVLVFLLGAVTPQTYHMSLVLY